MPRSVHAPTAQFRIGSVRKETEDQIMLDLVHLQSGLVISMNSARPFIAKNPLHRSYALIDRQEHST